jgi:hypothetical protein
MEDYELTKTDILLRLNIVAIPIDGKGLHEPHVVWNWKWHDNGMKTRKLQDELLTVNV